MSRPDSQSASKVYPRVAHAVLDPRDLEASLLLKAAAKLQAVLEAWIRSPIGSFRRFIVQSPALDRVHRCRHARRQQAAGRDSPEVLNLGMFVMAETFSLMTAPKPEHLANLIQINRAIAAGLGKKNGKPQPQRAA